MVSKESFIAALDYFGKQIDRLEIRHGETNIVRTKPENLKFLDFGVVCYSEKEKDHVILIPYHRIFYLHIYLIQK